MRKIILFDVIFYVAIPLLIWNYGRELLSDYYALLVSTVPGILYTIFRFLKQKQVNITGLFIIGSLFIMTSVNVLSQNAESMLWNQVYIGYLFASVFAFSMLIKKPLALYFAVDFNFLQGHARENSKVLFSVKGIFKWFQLLTGLFVMRSLAQSTLKGWLINTHGVDGYGKMIVYLQVSGWIFAAILFVGFIFVSSKINHYVKENDFKFPVGG